MKRIKMYVALFLLGFVIMACLFVPMITGFDSGELNISIRNQMPNIKHIFGTDSLGRDIFIRVCVGGRTSLFVSLTCALITLLIGCLYGGVSAFYPKADKVMMPMLDVFSSIPDILSVIGLSLWLGNKNLFFVVLSISLTGWYKTARLIRNLVKPLRTVDYIHESKSFNKSVPFIIFNHMLPNISKNVISRAVLSVPEFIFYESFLSYLGIGISPPNTSWGNLLSQAQDNFLFYPYQFILTSSFLVITLVSANWVGEFINSNSILENNMLHNNESFLDSAQYAQNIGKDAVLFVENLKVRYYGNSIETVKGVSFSIHEGEIVGLVGRSGCGKTTIARVVSGIISLYGGSVSDDSRVFFKKSIIDLSSIKSSNKLQGRNGVSLIYQDAMTSLDPTMKIGKQLEECLAIKKDIKQNAMEKIVNVMKDVGLEDTIDVILNMYPYQLSGGIAQRIMIAMAILSEPQLLVCDEPTASLDFINRKSIIELIKRISNKYKTAVIFISHDINAVREIAEKVIVMDNGVIVEELNSDKLHLSNNEFTRNLINTNLQRSADPSDLHTSLTFLKVDHLTYKYRTSQFPVINNISFKIKQGEIFGILGESGSGKTTLARILTGQIEKQNGVIWKSSEISMIQYLFQNPLSSFDPSWKIGKSIAEGVSKCYKDTYIKQLLNQVDLDESFMDKYPRELSLGQCQRSAIARALAVNPQLLICDEPTSALDSINQKSVLDLLIQLKESRKLTCIFISHDLDVVRYMSDRVAVMYKGSFVEIANTNEIFTNAVHPYTKMLLDGTQLNMLLRNHNAVSGCVFFQYCERRLDICRVKKPILKHVGTSTVDERHHFVACHYNRNGE